MKRGYRVAFVPLRHQLIVNRFSVGFKNPRYKYLVSAVDKGYYGSNRNKSLFLEAMT